MVLEGFTYLANRILEEAKPFYGDRLVSLAVFGSVARKTPRHDSDLDLLVVARDLPAGRMKRVREFERLEESLKKDLDFLRSRGIQTIVSAVFFTPEELTEGSILLLDMTEDVIILFDGDQVLQTRLDRLRKDLKEMGARKVGQGADSYWVMSSDGRSGKEIRI